MDFPRRVCVASHTLLVCGVSLVFSFQTGHLGMYVSPENLPENSDFLPNHTCPCFAFGYSVFFPVGSLRIRPFHDGKYLVFVI